MMVSKISFGTTSDFSEKIKQPQTYTVKEEPTAAKPISGKEKKHSAGKTFFKFLGLTAAIVGILALIGKTGVCAVPEGATGTLAQIKGGLDNAGKTVLKYFKEHLPQATEKITDAVSENASQAVNAVV